MTTEMTTPEQKRASLTVSLFNMLVNRAETGIAKAKVDVAKFAADIQTDRSAYHFEWASGAMKSAAYGNVSAQIYNALLNGATLWDMQSDLTGRIQHGAKYPEFSTSPTSNLMSQYTLSAYADYLETINNAIAHLATKGITEKYNFSSTTDEA